MNVNLSGSAQNIISAAHYKSAQAATQIASLPVQKNEVGSENYSSTSLIKPVLSLKDAEFQNSAGVKVMQSANAMIGSLLDERA